MVWASAIRLACLPRRPSYWHWLRSPAWAPRIAQPKWNPWRLCGTNSGGSERKADLHLQAPVIRRLVKALAVLRAEHLVRLPKERRGDVAGNRPGVGVIQQITDRHANR